MEGLREVALQLAKEQFNWASSAKELCEEGSSDEPTDGLLVTGGKEFPNLRHASATSDGVWEAVRHCWDDGNHLLSVAQRCKLASVLQAASTLLDTLLLCPQHFIQSLVKQLPHVPLEVVSSLHSASLISLESFMKASGSSVQYMAAAVSSLSCEESVLADAQRAVMQSVAEAMCELVVKQCPEAVEVVKQLPQAMVKATPTYSFLRAAAACPSVSSSMAEEVGAIMLLSHLEQPALPMMEAVSQQTLWQYTCLPQSIISLYSDLLSVLGTAHFIELLQKALSVEQLNWPALLQAVVCFLHHDASTPRKMSELVKELVSGGLEEGDTHLLICGVLFARQASLEGSHLFPSYDYWIQNMFGDKSGTVVKEKKELLLLLRTLSALVPHDPVFVLKAHASHPPRHMGKCLAQVNDYITLVSTRLQDLGEKVPSVGKTDIDVDLEVEEAIKHYSNTGCIPQAVMEASIFRQPYFLGRFLPLLLCPSTGGGGRDKFISALVREKIVPPRMMKRYEKACQKMKDREVEEWSGDIVSVLEELPDAVRYNRGGIAKQLSRLSFCLKKENSLPPTRAVQVVDHILCAICKAVVIDLEDGELGHGWVGDLLTLLSAHSSLHVPLYLRLTELLTTQLVHLVSVQLLGLAVLLCQVYHHAPPMVAVEDGGKVFCTGKEFCLSLLQALRHDVAVQFLRFGCMFLEQFIFTIQNTPLPASLLHKMVYMYRREKFIHHSKPDSPEVLQSVERLLQEHRDFAEQWHSCKISFEDWISWELDIGPEDEMSQLSRQSYQWREVCSTYLRSSSAEQLFQTMFKALVRRSHCVNFYPILQELARIVLKENCSSSPLLQTLQEFLGEICNEALATASMMLAASLPPVFLFCGSRDGSVHAVAGFVQKTLAHLVHCMMVMPFHITYYLVQGACSVAEDSVQQLCDLCPSFLVSLMVQWPLFPTKFLCSKEVMGSASWIHSGMQGPVPVFPTSGLLAPLSVAVWHKWTQHDDPASLDLAHLPAQVIVLVAMCCVHWLANNLHPHPLLSTVENLLQASIELEPSAIEAFVSDQTSVPEFVKLKHSQMLAQFQHTFSCKPSSFYPVLLLKFAGKLSTPIQQSLLTTTTCFLWLCVTAHAQCVTLSAPLPKVPPLACQPLSAQFIQEAETTIVALLEKANLSQLQNVLGQCHSELKPIVTSKLNSYINIVLE